MDAYPLEPITADDHELIQRAADIVNNADALLLIGAVVLITTSRAPSASSSDYSPSLPK